MHTFLARICVIFVLTAVSCARVLSLVDSSGEMAKSSEILNAFTRIQPTAAVPLFSLLHWKRDVDARDLNELLQADMKGDVEGAQLCDTPMCDGSLCIRACVASLDEPPLEGSKLADLCAATADVICVAVSSSELQYGSSSYAMPLIQAVLREKAQTASAVQLFVFVFGAAEGEEDADVQRATELVRQAWDELEKREVAYEDVVQAHVHALSKRNAVRMAAARSGLTDALRATTRASFQGIAEAIPSAWSVISRTPAKRVMNSMQRTALLRVDRAYESALGQLERLSKGWVQRVEDKKVVGGFGERADALAKRVLATFDEATVGVSFQRHRAQRRSELVQRITELYRTLFEQQAATLLADATQQLRKELLRVVRSNSPSREPSEDGEGEDEDKAETMDGVQVTEVAPPEQAIEEFMSKNGLPPESRQFVAEFFGLLDTIPSTKNLPVNELQTFEALLQVDYWLFNRLKDLEVPIMEVFCADTMRAAQRGLRDFVDKFPSSPAAQAAALQDTEEQLEKPPHARSLNIRPRLDFVVSVELPGSGNLQGYATYAFDFGTVWFAFSNERDKDTNLLFPAPPMLRIQPKLHFDVERK